MNVECKVPLTLTQCTLILTVLVNECGMQSTTNSDTVHTYFRACTCTNILHTKRLLYHWRCSFFGLELHASYRWQAMTQNIYCSLFLICHFVHFSSITREPQGAWNSTTHQTIPLLHVPWMLLFMLKQQAVTTY